MKQRISLFISFLLLFCTVNALAQSNKRVSGLLTDTTKTAIAGATVQLIAGRDTLKTTTNEKGYFDFSKIKSASFMLSISSMGYYGFTGNYRFGDSKSLELKPIELKLAGNMLNEVEIKAKPNPIRIMQDTVEYNAAAYRVVEGDNVADLIKQFPGIEVDDDYNVKTMGKEMTKLRVDGKDFFTNNVKDFISKLPAAIVAKIQVIDDFGDEANFTGIKIGEPAKMLNIVTKPGMNKGKFGNSGLKAGTNDQIGGNGNMNFWNGAKQTNGNVNFTTSNNGAGTSRNANINAMHNDKFSEVLNGGAGYGFTNTNSATNTEQAVETVNPLGTFYSNSVSNGETYGNNHNISTNFNLNNKKIFSSVNLGASYYENGNVNSSFNQQSGVIRQDLRNQRSSTNRSPRINANLNFSKKLKNAKNSFSANFGISANTSNSDQHISTNTLYYNKDTQVLEKDSLLVRDLITDANAQNFNFGFNYSLGLKKLKDSLARQSLNFSYSGSVGRNRNTTATYVLNNLDQQSRFIDSLSTDFTSLSVNQSLGANYNYNSRKMRYNIGFNARPTLLSSNYINLNQKIRNNNFNYSPNFNIGRTFEKGKTLSVNYSGSNNSPTPFQLQPIRNMQNLQNVIVGNPFLKPSFNHNVSSSFNYVNVKTGISMQTGLNFSTTQNEIVTNVLILPDTLNSLKQETRFENTNGTYNVGSNYSFNVPIKKNKISLSYSGSFGVSNRAVFINNEKNFNKGINFSQNFRTSVSHNKFSATGYLNYSFSSNNNFFSQNIIGGDILLGNLGQVSGATFIRTHNYRANIDASYRGKNYNFNSNIGYNGTKNDNQENQTSLNNFESYDFALSGNVTVKKSYRIGFRSTKRINTGFSLQNSNPFIIDASLSKMFLKDKSLSINLNANDLLGQNNNLNRFVSGNSIIDSRSQQVTRVFLLSLSYNLSRFGGKNVRVDADD
ncbi:MAG: hypothetical protein EOO47_02685 [Flavobacterium sp.]|nr:MAG: hypothetical protein EOO47_02685 [Flavobacterium sp.]